MGPLPQVLSKKMVAKLGSNVNENVAGGVSDFARRQLEKFGWKEGQGLGKKEDGIVEHVRVEKKSGRRRHRHRGRRQGGEGPGKCGLGEKSPTPRTA
mmetsp:Transcript_12314/g.28929  ORF Transcript_12314/g.28929 Transcript_12314/m.28929 type:complete len:97 (+) Transcript_12314:160-450(+)